MGERSPRHPGDPGHRLTPHQRLAVIRMRLEDVPAGWVAEAMGVCRRPVCRVMSSYYETTRTSPKLVKKALRGRRRK